MCVCMRVDAVISSWSPSRLSSHVTAGWGESEPGHTHLIRGFSVYVPWLHPQLYMDYRNALDGDIVLAVRYWSVQHHLGGLKSSDAAVDPPHADTDV